MKPIPAVPSRYLSIPPTAKVNIELLDINVQGSDRLVAVEQHHGAFLACEAHDLRDFQFRAVTEANVCDRDELVFSSIASANFSGGIYPVASRGTCTTRAPRGSWACQICALVGNSKSLITTLLRGPVKSSELANAFKPARYRGRYRDLIRCGTAAVAPSGREPPHSW